VRHFDALRDTMLGGFPPVRGSLRLTAGLGPRGIFDFARLLATGAQQLGERMFQGDGLTRVAVRIGDALRRAPSRQGQRDRRRLS
jgi:hypothetical protein